MDVLLVNVPAKERRIYDCLHPPSGLAYIASVPAINFNISGFDPLRMGKILKREAPRILGISPHSCQSYTQAGYSP